MDALQFKRGMEENLPQLKIGEPAFCTDTGNLYIGGSSGNLRINRDVRIGSLNALETKANTLVDALNNLDNRIKNLNITLSNIENRLGDTNYLSGFANTDNLVSALNELMIMIKNK